MPINDLLKNKHLNFVQRALNPDIFPRINNPDGSQSTHMMASGGFTDKGGPGPYRIREIAYPTIVQGENGQLQQLDGETAKNYAIKTGQFIEFPSQKKADEFASGGYKKQAEWERNYNKFSQSFPDLFGEENNHVFPDLGF